MRCVPRQILPLLVAFTCSQAAHSSESAKDKPERSGPIQPASECLDPERARSWSLLESDVLYVDAGRRRYLIELHMGCPELGYAKSLSFRTAGGVGRICGYAGEWVVADTGMNPGRTCRISKVHIIPRSAPRIQTQQRFIQARAGVGFFDSRRGDETTSFDASRRGGQ